MANRFAVSIGAGARVAQHVPWNCGVGVSAGTCATGLEWSVVVLDGLTVDMKVSVQIRNGDTSKVAERVIQDTKQGTSFKGCFEPPTDERGQVVQVVFDMNNAASWFTSKQIEIFTLQVPRKSHVAKLPSLQLCDLPRHSGHPEIEEFSVVPNLLETAVPEKLDPLAELCNGLHTLLDSWLGTVEAKAHHVHEEDANWLKKLQRTAMTVREQCQGKCAEKLQDRAAKQALEALVIAQKEQRARKEQEEAAKRAEAERQAQRVAEAAASQMKVEAERQERIKVSLLAAAEKTAQLKEFSRPVPQSQLQHDICTVPPQCRRADVQPQLLPASDAILSKTSPVMAEVETVQTPPAKCDDALVQEADTGDADAEESTQSPAEVCSPLLGTQSPIAASPLQSEHSPDEVSFISPGSQSPTKSLMDQLTNVASPIDGAEATPGHALKRTCYACSTTPEGACLTSHTPAQAVSTELGPQEPSEHKEEDIIQDCLELTDNSPEKNNARPSVPSPHCPPPARPVRRSACQHPEGDVQEEVVPRPCEEAITMNEEAKDHEVEEQITVPKHHVSASDVESPCKDSTVDKDKLVKAHSPLKDDELF